MKMFSRPVYSGWKPVPSSRIAETLPRIADAAGGLVERAGEDPQQRALAGAVAADHAHHLAAAHLEGDVRAAPRTPCAAAVRVTISQNMSAGRR